MNDISSQTKILEKLTNKKYLWTSPNLLYQFLADYVMDLVYQYSQQAVKLKKRPLKVMCMFSDMDALH